MKNVKPIVLSGILVLAMSAPSFAKGGTISATKTGTISGTRMGTISATGGTMLTSGRAGTISGTRTATVSATSPNVSVSSDHSWFIELLITVFARW